MKSQKSRELMSLSPASEKGSSHIQTGESRTEKLCEWTSSQKTDAEKQQDFKSHLQVKKDSSRSASEKGLSCNCKKTQCLKLYCQCFAYKSRCGPQCKCESCLNNDENEPKRQAALQAVEMRASATHGSQKIQNLPIRKLKSNKGCSCKKSGCLKKYCECYSANRKCSEFCVCEACRNSQFPCSHPSPKREELPLVGEQPAPRKKLRQRFLSSEQADQKLDEYLYELPESYHNNFLRFLFLVLQQ